MTERFFVSPSGSYLGAYLNAAPPEGSLEVPTPPPVASMRWDGGSWSPPPMSPLLPLSARQLRLGLLKIGIKPAQVDAAITALPEEHREAAEIEWTYASQYQRDHYLIGLLAASFGLTEDAVDAAWRDAQAL